MRGEARRGELAVCAALGAGRGRIVRQTLIESTLLAGLASVVGLLVTWWSLPALIAVLPEGLPRVEVIRVDGMVMLFVAVMAILTSLLAGLPPALLAARGDLLAPLHGSPRGSIGSSSARGRRALVVAQVAWRWRWSPQPVCLPVLPSCRLSRSALPATIWCLPICRCPGRSTPTVAPRAVPGEVTASVERIPASRVLRQSLAVLGRWRCRALRRRPERLPAREPGSQPGVRARELLDALGVRIVQGRAFADTDNDDAPDVAIVSENVARRPGPARTRSASG
jgi:hypothetical protein